MENEFIEEVETNNNIELSENELLGENDVSSSSNILSDNDSEQLHSDTSELDTEQSLEELLRQYFSGSNDLKSVDPKKDVMTETESGELQNANIESSEIDYSEILSELYDMASASYSIQEQTNSMLAEYADNNTLESNVNNISLSNTLLLYVCGCLLFCAVLAYGRRIF